jgi:5-(carboxyamino)imidazole ribonucleotide synthase
MRIGIVGAGQLGQMLGHAARRMQIDCTFLDPGDKPPAASCGKIIRAAYDNAAALAELAASCDVITYEFENVPVAALQQFTGSTPIYPPLAALSASQDRLLEKQLFDRLQYPLPDYYAVESRSDLDAAAAKLGLPLVIKTRRFGYDGKGQAVCETVGQLNSAWQLLGSVPLVAEQWVAFDFEISCVGARSITGDVQIYPVSRNVHRDGMLRTSRSPLAAPALQLRAAERVRHLLEHLDYVGVLALEIFVVGDHLLVNEFAPRVHNSGHWTIEGSATSQFENHVRAVSGLPLGATTSLGHAGMINLIGRIPDFARTLNNATLHDYGKAARANRKLGHVTIIAESAAAADASVEKIDTKCDALDVHN